MTLDQAFIELPALTEKLKVALEIIETAPLAPDSPNRLLLSIKETATLTGLSVSTLSEYISGRKLPYVKVGTRVLVDPIDLKAWIDARKVPALTKAPRANRARAKAQ